MVENNCKVENCDTVFLSIKMISTHIDYTLSKMDSESICRMLEALMDAKANEAKIFLGGAGRSGLVAKTFAMRLMHLGFNVFVIGETTTPAVRENDLVILISGSGNTRSIAEIGEIVVNLGAKLITVSSKEKSALANISDNLIIFPSKTKDDSNYKDGYIERHLVGDYSNLVPMGTSFEIMSLVFLDSIVAQLIQLTDSTEEEMKGKHANVE